MNRRDLVTALDARMTLSLSSCFPMDAVGPILPLPVPSLLTRRAIAVATMFDEGTPAEPPSQARINALGRLREGKVQISRKDWKLICWGLCDECGHAGMPINDEGMFAKVMQHVDSEWEKGLSRPELFGLIHSYFAYPSEHPDESDQWLTLRDTLVRSLPVLLIKQTRPKAWSQALDRHSELLTNQAGNSLAVALFNHDGAVANDVTTFLPIPKSSWLWHRIVKAQLALLNEIDDDRFVGVIPAMIVLAEQHPMQSDGILSGLLTRYEASAFRSDPHAELKQFALDKWQNPQVKSANRWSLVSDDVRRMVLQWFAKADLQHFFSLLQGDGEVDHARLNYWLRFVDQISYTRIVMGADAFLNRSADFVDFRMKNKGRFSQLSGGPTSNNAFVMRIDDHYFVEFSGTGNACYVYTANGLPFSPDSTILLLYYLKNKRSAVARIIHNGAWEFKADYALKDLGIHLGPRALKRIAEVSVPFLRTPIGTNSGQNAASVTVQNQNDAIQSIDIAMSISGAMQVAQRTFRRTIDHRQKGGAFWVIDDGSDPSVKIELCRLGFAYTPGRGYWIN